MATVYSLVCFGGRTGKTVTFTDAGDVVNLTNHGLRPGSGVVFSTTGALPTGLTAGTTYYAKQGADQNKFLLYPTAADAIAGTSQVTFSGTGTGTHNVKSAWMLGLPDLSRYGTSGSERIYDGLVSWNSGRSGASAYDVEVCEIGEAFSDIITSQFTVTIPSAQNRIETKIDGVRSAAFHAGHYPKATLDAMVLATGYVLYNGTAWSGQLLKLARYRDTIDGFTLLNKATASISYGVDLGVQTRCYRCIIVGAGSNATGATMRAALCEFIGNVVTGWATGVMFGSSQPGLSVMNNIITKCTNGFSSVSSVLGFFYNNISVGNTTSNWPTQPTALEGADMNAGLTGQAWVTGAGSRITIATTDFADHTNNDFYPASVSSPQVEVGVSPYGYPTEDLTGAFRPAYMNGGAAVVDVGPYEFDQGYGTWPANHVLTLTNVAVGSRVFIRDQDDTTTHFDQLAASSTVVVTATVHGDTRDNWRIRIRKASASPYYQPYETLMTATAGSSSIYVSQISDD